uniref:Uncharacterized protein n=1 Tax=Macaca fascicularis TaxID=9541 RepID=A0A7N9DFZ7_MACFA
MDHFISFLLSSACNVSAKSLVFLDSVLRRRRKKVFIQNGMKDSRPSGMVCMPVI